MSKTRNILIISYVFPPHFGIGGRRWAKLAKEMANRGHNVHVIYAKNPYSKVSLWYDEIKEHANISLYELPLGHPSTFIIAPANFFEKIQYRLWMILLKPFVKGAIFDRGIFWRKSLLKTAKAIISEQKIDTIYSTGAPFRATYYALELKKKYPQIPLITDLRDAWTWSTVWGFGSLTPAQIEKENFKEAEVIKQSDIVSVSAKAFENVLLEKYPQYASKIKFVSHFYDPADFDFSPKSKNTLERRILFFGTIYQGTQSVFEKFVRCMQEANNPNLSFHLYTEDSAKLPSIATLNANIHFHPTVPTKQLFAEGLPADYILFVFPDYAIDNISTKFYEVLATRTPVILIANAGMQSDFITSNGLGIHITPDEILDKLPLVLQNSHKAQIKQDFPVEEYSLTHAADKLLSFV